MDEEAKELNKIIFFLIIFVIVIGVATFFISNWLDNKKNSPDQTTEETEELIDSGADSIYTPPALPPDF